MFEPMNKIRLFILFCLLISELSSTAQTGFGVSAGLLQSIPFQKRDSFSGSPNITAGFKVYFPVNENFSIHTGLNYMPLKLVNNFDASGIRWQSLSLNIGNEWSPQGFGSTAVYTALHGHYVFTYGKNVLSQNSQSGVTFEEQKLEQRFFPSIEAGLTFKPRPLINVNISAVQPFRFSAKKDPYSMPSMLKITLEYRINTKQIKEFKKDSINSERDFIRNLKKGKLYIIEDRSDSSNALFRAYLETGFNFCKIDFVDQKDLKNLLNNSRDKDQIYFLKIGSIVYENNRPSTDGLILYNSEMQNPLDDNPIFIRNLSNDVLFEDPAVVKKLVKSLNSKLHKMYQPYR